MVMMMMMSLKIDRENKGGGTGDFFTFIVVPASHSPVKMKGILMFIYSDYSNYITFSIIIET